MLSSLLLTFAPVVPIPQGSDYYLNEIHARLDGTDNQEFIELRVPGGMSLDGFMILAVDGEALQAGLLDLAVDLSGLQAPADGYFVAGSSTVPNVDLVLGEERLLENGTQTIYLIETNDVAAIQAFVGFDVDPNSDFVTEIPNLATIHDAVALIDADVAAGWDTAYDNAPSFGPSDGRIPPGIFRADDGEWCNIFLDSDTTNSLDQPRSPGSGNQLCPRGELHPLDPRSGDRFGASLAVDLHAIAVGAPGRDESVGRAFLMTPDGDQLFEFELSLGFGPREYGRAVALDGNRIAIGSSDQDLDGGGVEVYDLATGNSIARYGFSSFGTPADFGSSVDIDGDYLVVGAMDQAVLYDLTSFSSETTLTSGSPQTGFGNQVAISGDFVAVSARSDTASGVAAGAVYVYEAATGNLLHTLVASDSISGLGFGAQLAADGSELLVGTSFQQGAYLFDLVSGTELIKYDDQDLSGPNIGDRLALGGDRIVFGSPGDTQLYANGGSITVLDKATGQTLLSWAPASLEPQDRFGDVVATDGTTIAATAAGDEDHGSNSGTVFTIESGLGSNFCNAASNSTGSPGRIYGFGSARVTANDLVLTAAPLPAFQPGLFVYGPSAISVPFGDGVRCVGGPPLSRLTLRTVRDRSFLQHRFDNSAPPTAAGQVTAGSTWYFQAWFRDPAAGGSGFNLSDGLELTFQP